MRRLLQIWTLALVALVSGASASADRIMVVLTIDGGSNTFRKAVVGALDAKRVEVISAARTARAMKQLRLRRVTSEDDAKKLAASLNVDTVIAGAFDRRAHTLKVTIFTNGTQGEPLVLSVGNAGRAFREAVAAELMPLLVAPPEAPAVSERDAAKPSGSVKQSDAEAPLPNPVVTETTTPVAVPDHAPPQASSESTGALAAPRPPSTTVTVETHARSERGANLAIVRVDLGASWVDRGLQFKSAMFAGAPPSYRSGRAAGGRIEAELHPLGGALAGFGIAADVDQATHVKLPAPGVHPVTERHYAICARYRIAFGHRPTSPTATLGVGYGARTFAVAQKGAVVDMPDVDYRVIEPGLALRVPLGHWLALTVAARALLVQSAGEITTRAQYGSAHAIGGTGSAGFELVFGRHVALRVVTEATQLELDFHGDGMLSTGRDGDPATQDVQGAVDSYYGGAATLALMY